MMEKAKQKKWEKGKDITLIETLIHRAITGAQAILAGRFLYTAVCHVQIQHADEPRS